MSDTPKFDIKDLPAEMRVNPIKDVNNPRSVINIVASSVANAIKYIPDSIFEMGADELKRQIKPSEIDERLRISFWREYDQAQATGRNINVSNVYGGICSQPHFLKVIAGNSFRLAYILTAPTEYTVRMEEMLDLALDQCRDILLQPHIKKNGEVDSKLAHVKVQLMESIQERVKGAVPHRMETKNYNVNATLGADGKPHRTDVSQLKSVADIDARLKELQREALGIPQEEKDIIDVQAKEEKVEG